MLSLSFFNGIFYQIVQFLQAKLPAYSIHADDDVIEAKFVFPNRKVETNDDKSSTVWIFKIKETVLQ